MLDHAPLWLATIVLALLPYVQGAVGMWFVRVLTNVIAILDRANMYVKQLLVLAANMGLAKLALLLGLVAPLTVTGLHDPTVILGAVGALFSMVIHAALKRKEAGQ